MRRLRLPAEWAQAAKTWPASICERMSPTMVDVAASGAAALAFDDRETAGESLEMLGNDPHVVAAAIYRAGGALFASYARDAASAIPQRSPPPPSRVRGWSHLELQRDIRLGDIIETYRMKEIKRTL